MCENNMLIGDPGYQNDKGAAEYFYYSSSWSLKNVYTDPDDNNSDKFGYALVADTNLFAISSTNWTGSENGKIGSGVTFVYSVNSGTATYIDRATPIEFNDDSHFITHIYVGRSVDLFGDYIAAGAPREATGYSYNYCGGIYIYSNKPHFTLQPRNVYDICNDDNTYFVIEGENYDSIRWQVSEDYQNSFQDIHDNNIYVYSNAEEFYILGNETPQLTDITHNYYRCKLMGQYGTTYSEPVRIVTSFIIPILYVSDTTIYLDNNGQFTINSSFVVDSVDKNNGCNILDTILSKNVFSCSDIGDQTIDVTVENINHNTKTETVTITVLDTISPIIAAHDTVIYADENCEATLPDFTAIFSLSDNCSIASTNQTPSAGTDISGTQSVTISAEDASGNETTVSFYVTVADTTSPVITSSHNDTEIDANENCQASLPDYTSSVTATDNCDNNLAVSQTPAAGTTISGTQTVTLTVTDDDGNTANVSFSVEVVDNTAPIVSTVYNDTILLVNSSCDGIIPNYTANISVTDNCDNSPTITQTPAANSTYQAGENVNITIVVSDDNSNDTTITFNVSIIDGTAPVITSAPADQNVSGDANCQYTLLDYTGDISATDNCSSSLTITQSPVAGTVITGYQIVTLTVTDEADNSTDTSFSITLNDSEPPTLTTKNATIYLDSLGNATLLPEQVVENATDNCALYDTLLSQNTFDCDDIGNSVSVTVTLLDAAGNDAQQTATVTVLDTIRPTVICLDNQYDTISEGQTYYTVVGTEFDPTSSDNCSIESIVNDFNSASTLSGAQFPVGSTTVVWTITDNSNNTVICSYDVIICTSSNTAIADLRSNIAIFPNPANDIVNIKTTEKITSLTITDISGQILISEQRNIEKRIDISNLPGGIYILKVETTNNIFVEKIIKR